MAVIAGDIAHSALAIGPVIVGMAAIVWGAETFAEHLAAAAVSLGVTTFALALLLAGAEPEELATSVAASLRHSPGIALGDVVGANVTGCLVALGVGALITPLAFGRRVSRYALYALPIGVIAVALAWSGHVTRARGGLLVALYASYVAIIWRHERQPPTIGEAAEVGEVANDGPARSRRSARDLGLVLAGLAAMVVGAVLLVDGVRRLSHAESGQTRLGLTLVGFATGFELVVLAWSGARRGLTDAVLASVLGSFAYNATMTLGVAALLRPLRLAQAHSLRVPLAFMLASLVAVVVLALPRRQLGRTQGILLLAGYPVYIITVLVVGA